MTTPADVPSASSVYGRTVRSSISSTSEVHSASVAHKHVSPHIGQIDSGKCEFSSWNCRGLEGRLVHAMSRHMQCGRAHNLQYVLWDPVAC